MNIKDKIKELKDSNKIDEVKELELEIMNLLLDKLATLSHK